MMMAMVTVITWCLLLLLLLWNTTGDKETRHDKGSRKLWMAYNEGFDEHRTNTECQELYKYHEPSGDIDGKNKYKLWPGLTLGPDQVTGERLFGFDDAMERIWQTQQPADCSTASYLLADSWYQGFGSEVHVLGVGLAIAVATNRVLLQDPKDSREWRIRIPHCEQQGKKNSECYFEPWSKCTVEDAYAAMGKASNKTLIKPSSGLRWTKEEDALLRKYFVQYGQDGDWTKVAEMIAGRTENECLIRWKKHLRNRFIQDRMELLMRSPNPVAQQQYQQIQQSLQDNKDIATTYGVIRFSKLKSLNRPENGETHPQVMTLGLDLMLDERNFVPPQFHQLLSCSPIPTPYWRFWWRSIAAAYFLRPNEETLKLLQQYRDPIVHNSEGHCVSTYIRHGDKGSEMRLVPLDRYAKTTEEIWKKGYLFDDLGKYTVDNVMRQKRIFYYGTETASIMKEIDAWSQQIQNQHTSIVTTNLTKSILDHRSQGQIHHMEFISYLVNLENIAKCRISICTYLSNFCRVVDELRVTVGGKANRYYAEVNSEICPVGKFCIQKDKLIANDTLFNELDPRLW